MIFRRLFIFLSVFFWGAGFYFYKENNAVDTELVEGWAVLHKSGADDAVRRNMESLDYIKKGLDNGLTGKQIVISHNINTKVPKTKPSQSTNDLDKIYEQAKVANVELRRITSQVAARTRGKAGFRPSNINDGLKGRDRAIEKINSDYQGDASKIIDVAGSKIVYDKIDELYSGLKQISESMEIIRIKDRIVKPVGSGYRDILMNVRMSNGHVVEMRLHLSKIDDVAKKEHILYQERRSIEANVTMQKRDYTSAEIERINKLKTESKQLYDNVWEELVRANK